MPKIMRYSPPVFSYGSNYSELVKDLSPKERNQFMAKTGLSSRLVKKIVETNYVPEYIAHRLNHATYGDFIIYDIKHLNTDHNIIKQKKLGRYRRCGKKVVLVVDVLNFFKSNSMLEAARYFNLKLRDHVSISRNGYLTEAYSYRIHKGTLGKVPLLDYKKVKSLGKKLPRKKNKKVYKQKK